jgi:hypothetical protein
LYKFSKNSDELTAYEDIFNKNLSAFVPVAAIVLEERKENSAKGT